MAELTEGEIWEELKKIFEEMPSLAQIHTMLKMRYLAEERENPDRIEPQGKYKF